MSEIEILEAECDRQEAKYAKLQEDFLTASERIDTLERDCESLDQDKRDIECQYNDLVVICDKVDIQLRDLSWAVNIGQSVTAPQLESISQVFTGLTVFA